MPTTVTKSIGTAARDYSTIQAWEDAAPASLVTADQIWKGECYNDSEFVTTAAININPVTDATRYVWLTTGPGQSFRDHASKETNALYYDVTKGVGIKQDPGNDYIFNVGCKANITNIQVKRGDSAFGNNPYTDGGVTTADTTFDSCIIVNQTTLAVPTFNFSGILTVLNSLIDSRAATGTQSVFNGANYLYIYSCVVLCGDLWIVWNSSILGPTYYYNSFFECVAGEFFDVSSSGGEPSGSNNVTTTGSGAYPNVFLSWTKIPGNEFTNHVGPAYDYRLKPGNTIASSGNPDALSFSGAFDILGRRRKAASPSIGAHEYIVIPTLSVAELINLTNTQATPRVTLTFP